MSDIPDSIKKCVGILKQAKSDTEKFAALFMAAKVTKGDDCNTNCKKVLFEAIGYKFLSRLLCSEDVPMDCPPQIYKSVALSILSSFCSDPALASHQEMISMVPSLLEVVQKSETEDSDDNLMIVSEAYECLLAIISNENGLKALRNEKGISKITEIYLQQTFQIDKALNILVKLLSHKSEKSWSSENIEQFNALLNKVALDFRTDNSERKFEICALLPSLLLGAKKVNLIDWSTEMWPSYIREGLKSILSSKITKHQRDPALKLVSIMINLLGVEWSLTDEEKPKQFLLLLIHLCSVEVRMQLEDRTLKEIMDNAELVVSCFLVLELTMTFISSDTLELEAKEKQQLYISLKGAFSAIVGTMNIIFKEHPEGGSKMDLGLKCFVSATIRALAAWMSQDPSALRDSISDLMPSVLAFANETFYSFRSQYISDKNKAKNGASSSEPKDPMSEVNLLRLLLPGMCHLTVDNKARRVILKEAEVLFECFRFHWSIVDYKKPPVPRSERLKVKKDEPIAQEILDDMKDSREAMVSLCNIFMNITVLEPEIVESEPLYTNLLKFIITSTTDLKNVSENLVLHANMSVLGLLLLKQQADGANKNDFSMCRYIQSTIRFLWDAYNIDESHDSSTIVVSMTYKEYWIELMELWFLGMQTLSSVIKQIPWVSEFAVESGWIDGIISTLKKTRVGSLPQNVKSAYEDLLCNAVDANKPLAATLKKSDDVLHVCRTHRFMDFGKRLFGN